MTRGAMMAVAMFCSACGVALVPGGRFCAGCGALVGESAPTPMPVATPVARPEIRTETEGFEYVNERQRDLDIVTMQRDGWTVKHTERRGSAWGVVYERAAPGSAMVAPATTITREYDNAGLRDLDVSRMAEYGWTVQQVQTIRGDYNGGRGCLLALILLPLALIAGRKPDRYVVTYTTAQPLGQALLPPHE